MDKLKFMAKGHSLLVAVVIALLLLVPSVYFSTISDDVFDEPREFLIVLLGSAAVLLIEARRVIQGRALLSGGHATWTRRLMLIFLGWAALSASFAVNSAVSWAYFLTLAAFVVVGISVLGWVEGGAARRAAIVGALAALVGAQVMVASAQLARLPLLAWGKQTPALMAGGQVLPGGFWPYDFLMGLGMSGADGQPFGTLGNVNYLGELLCLTLPVLACVAATSKRRMRWAVGLLSVAALGVLFTTGARGALLGLVVAAPIAAASVWGKQILNPMHHWRQPGRRVMLGLAMVLGIGMFAVTGERVVQKVQGIGQGDQAVVARLANWRSDISHVAARPIAGVGIGNYKVVNQDKLRADNPNGIPGAKDEGRFLRAHNEPLQALIEFGLVGLALLMAALIAWWRSVRLNEELLPARRFGILWGVGALLIAGCFGFPLHIPVTAVALVVIMAVGLARSQSAADAEQPVGAWRWAYAAVAIGLLAGASVLAIQKIYVPQYQAHQHLFAARVLYLNGRQAESAVVYDLLDRTVRYKGVYRIEYVRSLVKTGRYDEALRVLEASTREGLGFEAQYWKARALWGLGRVDDSQAAYKEVTAFFAPSHELHAAALKDLEAIERGN